MTKAKKPIIVSSIIIFIILLIASILVIRYHSRPIKSYLHIKSDEITKIEINVIYDYNHDNEGTYNVIDTKSFYNELSNIKVNPYYHTLKVASSISITIYTEKDRIWIGHHRLTINNKKTHRYKLDNDINSLISTYLKDTYDIILINH